MIISLSHQLEDSFLTFIAGDIFLYNLDYLVYNLCHTQVRRIYSPL